MVEKYIFLLICLFVYGVSIIVWGVTKETILLFLIIGLFVVICITINSILHDKNSGM